MLALVILTELKLLLVVSKSILLLAPAAIVVVPETVIEPVSEIAPEAVRDKSPVIEVVARDKELLLDTARFPEGPLRVYLKK